MIPHLMWLRDVNFVPLTYAGEIYSLTDRRMITTSRSAMSAIIWRCWRCRSCW